jgi:hypothetical protein
VKISTVNTIWWVAVAIFWTLLIADLVVPGKEPWGLAFARHLSVYVFLSAQFYVMGARRADKKTTTYEMSK